MVPHPLQGLVHLVPEVGRQLGLGVLQGLGDGGQRRLLGVGPAAEAGLHPLSPAAAAVGQRLPLLLEPLLDQELLHLRPLPEEPQILLGKGGGHLGPLGQAPQVLVLLGELGQHLPQVQSGLDGPDHVHGEHRRDGQGQRVHEPVRHPDQQPSHRRVEKADQQDGEEAPGDGAGQTDVAVEVELMLGVVPVADLEELFHGGAHHVLQRRGGQHAQQPHQPQVLLHRQGDKEDDDGAGAVDGQHRPLEKAPVHPVALAQGDVAGLPHPAAKAVEEKQQDPLACGIDVHNTSLS